MKRKHRYRPLWPFTKAEEERMERVKAEAATWMESFGLARRPVPPVAEDLTVSAAPKEQPEEELMTRTEAAAYLGLKPGRIDRLVKLGWLHLDFDCGERGKLSRKELEAFMRTDYYLEMT